MKLMLLTHQANLRASHTLVGRNLDVKLEVPRSLIVNLAKNLIVNLEMLVNPDVDVVKYQYYI